MIGLNLRVTGHCNQGGRKYMEDAFVVAYQQTKDKTDLEYAYFGIFDGHGGREAALYAKEHLLDAIVKQSDFWSNNDEHVLRAIKHGFLTTHLGMWKEVGKWPKTMSGLPSTSGTTASIAFIRRGKLFIGHVGDSRIVLGCESMDGENWYGQPLTHDHKPESPRERERIHSVGGLVMNKSGVDRVVWNRPSVGHRGPVRRSTHFDKIPFLAVARSLGDLWSYNYTAGKFVVSPEPDVSVVKLDTRRDRCIVMASDGLWNMVDITESVRFVQQAERDNEHAFLEAAQAGSQDYQVYNPSKMLVDEALYRWGRVKTRADNTSVVTVMLDPAGPSRNEVLLRQRFLHRLRPREELRTPEPQAPASPRPGSLAPDERELSPPRSPTSDPESDEPEGMRGLPRVVILTPKRVYPSISPPSLRAEAQEVPSQEPKPEPECKSPEQKKEASDSTQENDATAGSHKRRLPLDNLETEEVAQKRPHNDSESEATDEAADNTIVRARKTRL
ncbi:protein phosphatase 1D-like isoform X1 [Dermacentor andersoni]|uniref:protein phosphatase 1D-like isoform X1 n=1 Tax=Dermacentor andersoni TaxID=34620 RepID=UPI0021556BEE